MIVHGHKSVKLFPVCTAEQEQQKRFLKPNKYGRSSELSSAAPLSVKLQQTSDKDRRDAKKSI